ncbi:MAG: YaaR family protein [Spirochaetales bacterium]
MERISGDGFFSYRQDVDKKKDAKSRRIKEAGLFDRALERLGRANAETLPEISEAETAELLDAVFEAGDKLKNDGSTQALLNYKSAVRSFLSRVVKSGIGVEEQTSGTNILKRKRYTLVRVIDSKLERLAAGMISSQRDQVALLQRIDEINGLLVDLTH